MEELSNKLKNSTSKTVSREIIKSDLDNINKKIGNVLEKYNETYEVNYGMNYFPEKTFKNVKYKEGMYESLVIKIGKGEGDNWWCFLFPPFCLIESNDNNNNQIEYKSYLKEIFNNKFK